MGWPAFQTTQWAHIRREAEKNIKKLSGPIIFTSDIDVAVCEKLGEVVAAHALENTIRVTCADFFALRPANIPKFQPPQAQVRPGLVVLNPPYGRRLGSKNNADSLFVEIGKKLKKDFSGWRLALLVPDRRLLKQFPVAGITTHDFFHGGLTVTLLCGRIP